MQLIFEKIRTMLYYQYHFEYHQIQLETKFKVELGTDSREMLELIKDFEIAFDIEIDSDDIIKTGTHKIKIIIIQDIVNYIKRKTTKSKKLL